MLAGRCVLGVSLGGSVDEVRRDVDTKLGVMSRWVNMMERERMGRMFRSKNQMARMGEEMKGRRRRRWSKL